MRRADRPPQGRAGRASAALLLVAAGAVSAQNIPDVSDWMEGGTPPPPAFDAGRLLALPNAAGSTLTIGIDPATLAIGADGVVRYVFIARSESGALNVSYEGIRCANAEFRRYARWQQASGWVPLRGEAGVGESSAGGLAPGDWQPLRSTAGRFAWQLARGGICRDAAPNASVHDIVRDMRISPLILGP